jgi:hypothetical protein
VPARGRACPRFSPVVGTVTADDGSDIAAITCTGASIGPVSGLGMAHATAPLTVSGDGIHAVSCTATDGLGNAGAGPRLERLGGGEDRHRRSARHLLGRPDHAPAPNHRLVAVTTQVSVDGGLSGSGGFTLTAATSSEPDQGLGDGETANDIQDWTLGAADTAGQLRAERSGQGSGRTCRLSYRGAEGAGKTASCTVTVTVPHD